MQILIFHGTIRQGNYSQHVAKFLATELEKVDGVSVERLDPAQLPLSFENEGYELDYPTFTAAVKKADGIIMVVPEYNHGYPGTLKHLLDTNNGAFSNKAVGVVGVSSGPWGGTRVIEHLTPVFRHLGSFMSGHDLHFTMVQKEIEKGSFVDAQKWQKRVKKFFDDFLPYVEKISSLTAKKES